MEQTENSVGKTYAYEIKGGVPLKGDIDISGSKNAALGVIAASIMVDGVCTLENVPDILDVHVMFDLLMPSTITLIRSTPRLLIHIGHQVRSYPGSALPTI